MSDMTKNAALKEAVVVELLPCESAEKCAASPELQAKDRVTFVRVINGVRLACGGIIRASALKVNS
ncbi:hypothetical protein [Pseudomonas syringae group genomosp. 3]|uniref:hypothetical protein n=1 Tax=Pseudomonas syringae group genomosp. 3 TaxID=251701 RepID=UPI0006B944CB|nr:hypothetical protein [Pseudomonas syringae group genomosp. 3]